MFVQNFNKEILFLTTLANYSVYSC